MTPLNTTKPRKKVDYRIDPQLRVLFNDSDEFKVCMLDTSGSIIGWNTSAERMTGYTAKEVLGKNYSIFISKAEAHRHVFTKALAIAAKTGQYIAEGIRVRKDKTHFWSRTFITPVKGKDGNAQFFVLITMNIMRERTREQKKEEYIGIASHELKNPITTLSLYAELLGKGLELESDKKNLRMLRNMQDQTARLVALVDDLLIVSKIEGGSALKLRVETFDPVAFIQKLTRDAQKNISTHTIISKGVLRRMVRADKDKIAQVVINLLANAVKYSPGANTVTIRVAQVRNKCVISIQDFGSGIAKKDQRDIFTRFFRADDVEAGNIAGVGLGLYISKEIIRAHRQRIWVKSAGGQGTTFSFTLPFSR